MFPKEIFFFTRSIFTPKNEKKKLIQWQKKMKYYQGTAALQPPQIK